MTDPTCGDKGSKCKRIVIGFDFCPTEPVKESFLKTMYEAMFSRMLEIGYIAKDIKPVFKQFDKNGNEIKEAWLYDIDEE